jgi:hypothetical protein
MFDGEDDEQAAQAVELCRRCESVAACSAWADGLAPNTVSGVVAGRLYTWTQSAAGARPRGRPRKALAS